MGKGTTFAQKSVQKLKKIAQKIVQLDIFALFPAS